MCVCVFHVKLYSINFGLLTGSVGYLTNFDIFLFPKKLSYWFVECISLFWCEENFHHNTIKEVEETSIEQ